MQELGITLLETPTVLIFWHFLESLELDIMGLLCLKVCLCSCSSQNSGQVHIVALNNYIAFGTASAQYAWFVNDMTVNLNRKNTPWVIIMFHAPVYVLITPTSSHILYIEALIYLHDSQIVACKPLSTTSAFILKSNTQSIRFSHYQGYGADTTPWLPTTRRTSASVRCAFPIFHH